MVKYTELQYLLPLSLEREVISKEPSAVLHPPFLLLGIVMYLKLQQIIITLAKAVGPLRS